MEQLRGLANVALHVFPLLLVTPIAVTCGWRARPREAAFLVAAFAGLLGLSFTFHPDLGFRRDADLLGMYALPGALLVALWWDAKFTPRQRAWCSVVIAAASFAFLVAPALRFP